MKNLFVGALSILMTSAVSGQVFVENFDTAITGWVSYPAAGAAQFSSEDLNNSGSSGSAEVTANTNEHGVRKCVDTNIPSGTVDFGMYGFFPVTNTAVGQTVQCTFFLYSADSCASSLGTFNTVAVAASGVWANTASSTVVASTVESITAQCGVGGGNVDPGDIVRVDRIYAGPAGTVPVELITFSVD